MIDAAALLLMFANMHDAQLVYPMGRDVEQIVASLPKEQEAYQLIVEQALPVAAEDPETADDYERIINILRLLLYVDGRTEDALLLAVDATSRERRTATLAINPLAALANYYGHGGRPSRNPSDLIARFDRYSQSNVLFVNALACKRALLRQATRGAGSSN